MGFLDGLWGRRSDDPLQDLDPKVREFLKKESPVKHDSSKTPSSQDDTHPAVAAAAAAAAHAPAGETTKTAGNQPDAVAVPKESFYQDGRYAHLWKTYRPQAEIENETKSDHEKLQDVLDAFKSRKAAIGSAALENCADEQMDWSNCMRGGSMRARMTMCSDEVRKFERCYNMQSVSFFCDPAFSLAPSRAPPRERREGKEREREKSEGETGMLTELLGEQSLLKALGYLNAIGRSPEIDERIQLHADKLYHQMLEQEDAVANAQKEGKPIPTFEPVLPKQVAGAATADADVEMSESAKKRVQSKLDKLAEHERDAEEAALQAEMRSKAAMIGKIKELWKEQEAEREARRQKGAETMWDKATGVFKPSSGSSGEK